MFAGRPVCGLPLGQGCLRTGQPVKDPCQPPAMISACRTITGLPHRGDVHQTALVDRRALACGLASSIAAADLVRFGPRPRRVKTSFASATCLGWIHLPTMPRWPSGGPVRESPRRRRSRRRPTNRQHAMGAAGGDDGGLRPVPGSDQYFAPRGACSILLRAADAGGLHPHRAAKSAAPRPAPAGAEMRRRFPRHGRCLRRSR